MLPVETKDSLQILVLSARPGAAFEFQERFREAGFAITAQQRGSMGEVESGLPDFDLVLIDSEWPHLLPQLSEAAPEVPVVAFQEGPRDHAAHLRWLRDGALDCLFSKESRELTPLAYQALSLRRRHRERRRQEHAVDSWEVFRSVVRACPYAIIVLDRWRKVMLWSGGAPKVTGYQEEEMLGREMPGVSPKELDFLIHGLAEHPFQEAELGWHRRDGAPYVARVRAAVLQDTQGQAQGTVLMVADITNRYDLYAQSITSRLEARMAMRFQNLLEAAPDAVLEVDEHGVIVLANASCERMFGYKRDELLGQVVEVLVPMPAREKHLKLRAGYAAHPSIRPMGTGMTLKARRKDGSEMPVEITLSPLHLEGVLHTAVVIRDVTEARRLADAQRESAEQARSLFALSPVPCWVYDAETLEFLDANQRATQVYGYTLEEFRRMTILGLRPAEDHDRIRHSIAGAPESMESGPWRHVAKNGSVIEAETQSHEITYGGRKARLVVVHNVTERRRFEEALHDAKSRAETASRAKSEFLASMSHELRSPLHTIIGFSELLAEEIEGPLNEKQRRFVSHIHKDSQHLLTLINDILDLSKIEAGRMELNFEEFDAHGVVDEAMATVQPQAAAKAIELDSTMAGEVAVRADAVRVRQILLNLLTNAVKFTPSGGRIRVESVRMGNQIAISVVDTGIGIPAEHRESIFEVFYQVSATTKGVREGTGLGLAICRSLAEGMGGRIWVESEPGRGSRFTFTVPSVGGPRLTTGREKPVVLVLEDDPGACELIREYLEPEGMEIICVTSIRETLVKALDLRPDIILLDLLLAGGSGWDALRGLKSLQETQAIPVVIVSVVADDTALRLGADAFLVKPVKRETLVSNVRRVLGHGANPDRR